MKGCGSFVFKAMQALEKFNWKILVIFLENPGEKDYNEGSRLPGCGLPVRKWQSSRKAGAAAYLISMAVSFLYRWPDSWLPVCSEPDKSSGNSTMIIE